MTDISDRATEHEELMRGHALARQQALSARPPRESAEYCEQADCGQPIPERRRLVLPGVQLCVECQERLERMGRL